MLAIQVLLLHSKKMLRSRKKSPPEAYRVSRVIESTKVLFPRFEYEEADDSKSYSERKLVRRAEPHRWLPDVEVEPLLSPRAVVAEYSRQDIKGQWWGVYHSASWSLTLGQLFHSPFSDTTQLYRSWLINHDYLWDEQATSGCSAEIVLERLRTREPVFEEIMAIESATSWRKDEGQRVVMKNEAGEWQEPHFGQEYAERDYYFAILRSLATREGLVDLSAQESLRPAMSNTAD